LPVKSIPFAVQLSLFVFLILIIPFIALMSYTSYATLQYSEEEIARNSLENIEVNRRFTETFMNSIAAGILRFVADHEFAGYTGMHRYGAIQGNVDNGIKIQRLQRELLSIAKNESAILSIFFLFDGGDYVISTDRGIVELSDYYSLAWLRSVPEQKRGLGGIWVPRELRTATLREIIQGRDSEQFTPVISYVYSLNRLTTAIGGTLAVNIRESSVAEMLNPGGRRGNSPYGNILLQRDGKIISHPDGRSFLLQGRNLPRIAEILDREEQKGARFFREGNNQLLYTWLKTGFYEWVYLSVQSMEILLGRSARLIRTVILLSVTVLFLGTLASLAVFSRISRPMRLLVNGLRENAAAGVPAVRNEMEILSSAFARIEHQEKELRELLGEREKDAVLLAIRRLLSEDHLGRQEEEILEQVFPHKLFKAAVAAPDSYEDYRRRTTPEQRAYHRYLFVARAEQAAAPPLVIRGDHLYEAQIALIINFPEERIGRREVITSLLGELQKEAPGIFGATLSFGLSETGFDPGEVRGCVRQAAGAAQMRMLRGAGSIIPWEAGQETRKRFFYPRNSEGRILNYLDAGSLDLIKRELDAIKRAIQGEKSPEISPDNISFIYNQLAGITIKRLSEMNVDTAGFFSEHGSVYRAIAACETLDQISLYMEDFYQDILSRRRRGREGEEKPIDRILACFEKHYREDMFFEDMAAELGISYSYMRKIVREAAGASVLDTINRIRIREAKKLLLDSGLSPAQIAGEVGYRNVQSLNRYFKKFEGLSPLEYRLANRA
jgi:AraC-like DNA-binding protein